MKELVHEIVDAHGNLLYKCVDGRALAERVRYLYQQQGYKDVQIREVVRHVEARPETVRS